MIKIQFLCISYTFNLWIFQNMIGLSYTFLDRCFLYAPVHTTKSTDMVIKSARFFEEKFFEDKISGIMWNEVIPFFLPLMTLEFVTTFLYVNNMIIWLVKDTEQSDKWHHLPTNIPSTRLHTYKANIKTTNGLQGLNC